VSAAPLTSRLQDPRVLAFLLVLFGVNLLFGLGSISMAGVEQAIAWQAHIGGFLAGLLAFAAFDPIPISTGGGPNEGMDAPPPAINLDTIAGCALLAVPRRSSAALRVRCECGARGDTCAWRLSSCADCVNLSVFVSCCGALRGARNAAGRLRVSATAFRPIAVCAM